MAVYTNVSSALKTRVQTGTKPDGSPIRATCTYNGIDSASLADDVIAVSNALAAVIQYPIVETTKVDTDLVA